MTGRSARRRASEGRRRRRPRRGRAARAGRSAASRGSRADEHARDECRQDEPCPARDEDRDGNEPGGGERENELQRPCRRPFGELSEGDEAERIEGSLGHANRATGRRTAGAATARAASLAPGRRVARRGEPEPENEEECRRNREEIAFRDVVDPAGGERPDFHHDGDRPGGAIATSDRAAGSVSRPSMHSRDHQRERDQGNARNEHERAPGCQKTSARAARTS